MRSTPTARSVVLAAALVVLAAQGTVGAAVQVARGEAGLTISATGERLETVLGQLADAEGFAVSMQEGIERYPVDVEVRDATVEEALRAVLRGRNYVIAYEERPDGLAVSRVEVLLPRSSSEPQPASAMQRVHAAQQAAQQRAEARRKQDALQRLEQTRAARLQQRRAAQAQAQARAPQAAEPVPLRRLLWGRAR